jgi:hypothetical protein
MNLQNIAQEFVLKVRSTISYYLPKRQEENYENEIVPGFENLTIKQANNIQRLYNKSQARKNR